MNIFVSDGGGINSPPLVLSPKQKEVEKTYFLFLFFPKKQPGISFAAFCRISAGLLVLAALYWRADYLYPHFVVRRILKDGVSSMDVPPPVGLRAERA